MSPPSCPAGRWPAKAVVGETFTVTATVFREGHDAVAANVVLRDPDGPARRPFAAACAWRARAPTAGRAEVTPDREGRWTFAVEAWSDPVATWRHDVEIKIAGRASTSS